MNNKPNKKPASKNKVEQLKKEVQDNTYQPNFLETTNKIIDKNQDKLKESESEEEMS